MREILFRGIVKYNGGHYFSGDFIDGYYFESNGKHYIRAEEHSEFCEVVRVVEIEVIPETIGQSWKKDRNENKMFSGDIIKVHQFLFDGNEIEEESTAKVVQLDDGFALEFISGDFIRRYTGNDNHVCMATDVYGLHEESFEIIGNIHENKEES